MGTEIKTIMTELHSIKEELEYIKKHMVNVDSFLTTEEEERLNLSLKEKREKKTISLMDLKKELGV